jgi:DNA-binding IclR family transcriptional regulator
MLDLPESEWARLYKLAKEDVSRERRKPPGFLPWPKFRAAMRTYRERGYTMEKEENQASIVCVGAPIRNARGDIVAGLSIASATVFMPAPRMLSLAPVVQACAREISRGLGYTQSTLTGSSNQV